MAVGSSRRRKPKRPSSDPSPPPMAFSSSSIARSGIKISNKSINHLRKRFSFLFALVAFSLLLLAYINSKKTIPSPIDSDSRFYTFEVVNEFPHDPNAFTQGLLYGGNDTLFESTGLYGRSSVRQVLLQTGKVLVNHKMGSSLFGEGLTLQGERGRSLPIRCRMAGGWRLMVKLYLGVMEAQHFISLIPLPGKHYTK